MGWEGCQTCGRCSTALRPAHPVVRRLALLTHPANWPIRRAKATYKVARDNTVKYQWRVLQLLPGAERPSYAGLRVEVLERADGELMLRYQGKVVDFQEGPPPSSALWGAQAPDAPRILNWRRWPTAWPTAT